MKVQISHLYKNVRNYFMQCLFFKVSQRRQLCLVPDYLSLKAIYIRAYELLHYAPFDKLIAICCSPLHIIQLVSYTKHDPHSFDILEQKLACYEGCSRRFLDSSKLDKNLKVDILEGCV